jgi:DNA primase
MESVTGSVFGEIKSRLDMPEVATSYGIEIGRGNMAKCPFHNSGQERHPSMKLYSERFKCFACGATGDIIELTQKLHNLSTPLDAARLLNNDFCLNLFGLTPAERKRAREAIADRERDRQLAKSFDSWCDDALHTVRWYLWHLRELKAKRAPKRIDDEFTADFRRALCELGTVEYMYDVLAFGGYSNKIDFFQHWRKRVQDIESYRKSHNTI